MYFVEHRQGYGCDALSDGGRTPDDVYIWVEKASEGVITKSCSPKSGMSRVQSYTTCDSAQTPKGI